MRRAVAAANGKKTKAKLSERGQALLDRIRRRREEIRARVGLLSDSFELIRKERDRRF
jgi:molybdenum-dependent DNA-binding transcriptional regulator ModE